MVKRSLVRVTGLAIVLGLIGMQYRVQAVPQTTVRRAPDLCVDSKKADYSAYAVMLEGTQRYQCVPVYGKEMAPAGLAWVKLTEANSKTIYTIGD